MSERAIRTVAIANRGEVAVRIIRACQDLGLQSVLLHSEADTGTCAYRLSDQQICVGASPVGESYLNIAANVRGAVAAGADAVHPGFGFLSENADFAQACLNGGLHWIGPSPEAIRAMGEKTSAKQLAEEVGLPTVPGYRGDDQSLETLKKKIAEIGYPVMVKAAAGGGGRGLKVIYSASEAEEKILSAQREGLSAFASDRVFLEKYLDRAKHIEVQVFGDASGRVHALYDRECSVQRRHQKVIEEALSPSLSEEQREWVNQAARKLAERVQYRGAGTVEFLFQDGQFYFLEMNTRLQVEHPVTEMVLGIDLVQAQILTAMGKALPWPEKFAPRGHAIECRIYAEDPFQGGIPSTGKLGGCLWPEGPGRRFEVGFAAGDEVTAFYDSMIAKVIVWDETRERARVKLLNVLSQTVVFGLSTNIPFLQSILHHPEFAAGTMTTRFIENHFASGLPARTPSPEILSLAASLRSAVVQESVTVATLSPGLNPSLNPSVNLWLNGWRNA